MRIRRLNKNTLIIFRHKDFFTSLIRKSDDSNKTNKKKLFKNSFEKNRVLSIEFIKKSLSLKYFTVDLGHSIRFVWYKETFREKEREEERQVIAYHVYETRGYAERLRNYCGKIIVFITIIMIVPIEGTRGNPTSHFHDGISSQSTGLPIGETDRKDRHAYAFGFAERVIRFNFAWLYNGLFCISGHFWMTIVCAGVIDSSGLGTDLVVYTRL